MSSLDRPKTSLEAGTTSPPRATNLLLGYMRMEHASDLIKINHGVW
jgi:hypothetical protein